MMVLEHHPPPVLKSMNGGATLYSIQESSVILQKLYNSFSIQQASTKAQLLTIFSYLKDQNEPGPRLAHHLPHLLQTTVRLFQGDIWWSENKNWAKAIVKAKEAQAIALPKASPVGFFFSHHHTWLRLWTFSTLLPQTMGQCAVDRDHCQPEPKQTWASAFPWFSHVYTWFLDTFQLPVCQLEALIFWHLTP